MFAYIHHRSLILALGLWLFATAQNTFSATSAESDGEKILIPLTSSPEFTFTLPMKARFNFFLLNNKNTKPDFLPAARITISDQDCATGHQVSVNYDRTSKEILMDYFHSEIPWGSTYKLKISRDLKTDVVTLILNGETLAITPFKKAKFVYLQKTPGTINILNIEQN